MAVTVESIGKRYSIKGHLYPLQWWVISCLISASATDNFAEHFVWTANEVTYLRHVSWYRKPYFCGENGGQCFARFEFEPRPNHSLKFLGNLSETYLVAVEFTAYGGVCDEKRRRIERYIEVFSEVEWFRFAGRMEEKFYLFLRMHADPLEVSWKVNEIRKAESETSLFSNICISTNIFPHDFVVSEMMCEKDCPCFYLLTEPSNGKCLNSGDVVLFDSESQLRDALVELLEQPQKKFISSGLWVPSMGVA